MSKSVDNVYVLIPASDERKAVLEAAAPKSHFNYMAPSDMTEADFKNADVIIGWPDKELLPTAEKLQLLQLHSAGSDMYAKHEYYPQGATLCNATGSYGMGIGEYLVATLLALDKKLHVYRDGQHREDWIDLGEMRSLYGSTVLVVGLGDIGGEFAKRVKALGAHVIGVRRTDHGKPDFIDEMYTSDKLDDVIPRADTIALCLPNSESTTNIMDRDRINLMKQKSVLMNIGRGAAIDGDALCDALDSGRLWGAAVDVTNPEPLPQGHRMWKTKNLIVTPHVSGGTSLPQTTDRIFKLMADNLLRLVNGKSLRNLVDFNTGYKKTE